MAPQKESAMETCTDFDEFLDAMETEAREEAGRTVRILRACVGYVLPVTVVFGRSEIDG